MPRQTHILPPNRARREASQGTCTCQKPGLGTFDNDIDDDDNDDNDNDNDDDKDDDKNDDDDDGFCFLAHDEVGMRQAGCASPEQSVLSITVSSVNTKEPVLMIESVHKHPCRQIAGSSKSIVRAHIAFETCQKVLHGG